MSIVRGLVLLHLSATALLLVVFVAVAAFQRSADLVRQRWVGRRAAAARPQAASASVLDWTIDLRSPASADSGAVLQQTS